MRDLDDLVDHLSSQMRTVKALLASMSSIERKGLQALMDAALHDDCLRWELMRLGSLVNRMSWAPQWDGLRPPREKMHWARSRQWN